MARDDRRRGARLRRAADAVTRYFRNDSLRAADAKIGAEVRRPGLSASEAAAALEIVLRVVADLGVPLRSGRVPDFAVRIRGPHSASVVYRRRMIPLDLGRLNWWGAKTDKIRVAG